MPLAGFWNAVLNPGRKRKKRRGSGRRRRLSAWQKMVKRHGGVQGALKARRSLRKAARKAHKRRGAKVKRGHVVRRRERRRVRAILVLLAMP